MAENWQIGGFGLYLHWPFCQAKCPYCDFNSHVAKEIDQSAWLDAYLLEIDRYADMLPGRILSSVFFGGGTPSLMDPDVVGTILERIRNSWPTVNDLEVTLEANPGSVEAGRFRGYADGGVNRISMGIQALNDNDLQRLGRIHTAKEARQAFDIARNCFNRISFDLIYARQDQTLAAWEAELQEALSMAVDHLSLYQLTIEEGTAFGNRYAAGKLRGLPQEDLSADMFQSTQEICDAAGLPAYEVSNHAQPGSESRHNLIYWNYGDYVGIGPGAHGRISRNGIRYATEAYNAPTRWLKEASQGKAEHVRSQLSGPEQADEYLMMGLRINEGIDPVRYKEMAGSELPRNVVEGLERLEMITSENSRIRATDRGRMLLNAVIKELLSGK